MPNTIIYRVLYWELDDGGRGEWVEPWNPNDNYEDAIAQVREDFPDAVIGHDNDLPGGGNATYCWENERMARAGLIEDACALIRRDRKDPKLHRW